MSISLLKPSANNKKVRVHPRCKNLRAEMASYRRDANGKIIKAFDHSIDALRYGTWARRYEAGYARYRALYPAIRHVEGKT